MRSTEAVRVIVGVMAPYIGDTMARSAAQAHCRRLGIGESCTAAEREALLARLGAGLNIFLGRERSGAVLDQARRALLAADGQP
jgi:hypothetical protein